MGHRRPQTKSRFREQTTMNHEKSVSTIVTHHESEPFTATRSERQRHFFGHEENLARRGMEGSYVFAGKMNSCRVRARLPALRSSTRRRFFHATSGEIQPGRNRKLKRRPCRHLGQPSPLGWAIQSKADHRYRSALFAARQKRRQFSGLNFDDPHPPPTILRFHRDDRHGKWLLSRSLIARRSVNGRSSVGNRRFMVP